MCKRLIIFLIRRKLGVKKFERFRFKNQKQEAEYYFTGCGLTKETVLRLNGIIEVVKEDSGVSLNWLLNDECEIEIL